MISSDEIKWAWIAGIIEGEGCFRLCKHRDRRTADGGVIVHMTDEDTIRRLHEWSGRGKVTGPKIRPNGYKPIWTWGVSRCEESLYVIGRVRPYLLSRRGAKADEVEAVLRAKRPKDLRQSPEEKRAKKTAYARSRYAANREKRNEYMKQWMRKKRADLRYSPPV